MRELKIHVILYLIQIYLLTKYLVENAKNSISETTENLEARICKHHLKNSILLAPRPRAPPPPPPLRPTSNYASPSLTHKVYFRFNINKMYFGNHGP